MQSELTYTSQPVETNHFDTAIVGGGLAGLTAAAYLARAGRTVVVFEKAETLGGRAATTDYDGFAFNRGVHAIYTGGAMSQVLAELGVTYTAGRPADIFVLDRDRGAPRLTPFPDDPWSLLRSSLFSWRDKLELVRALSALPKIDAHTLARVSVEQWIAQRVQRPLVRQFLTALARTQVYSAALDVVSADVLVDKLQLALKHPIHYVDGGWRMIVDGLRRAAVAAGAEARSDVRVEAIEREGERAIGVRLGDGSSVRARSVVLATAPQEAVRLVDGDAGASLRRAVDQLTPAYLACLDVALSQLPDPQHPIVQDLDRPLFVTAQSRYARVAPAGAGLIHAFKQLDPRQPNDPRSDERELETLLDTVQPGWRARVVKRIFLPHILAVGTLPTAATGGFAGRPGVRVPGLANVYLAGDWVGAEGFLADTSFASARDVAQLILEEAAVSATHLVETKGAPTALAAA